jgi:hypothetical protein
MSKKNLDKIFQEKFEEFSDVPTEKVWKSIEASLNKKKKNRMVIPFWWKLGGIAAALAIGLFFINPFKDDGNETNIIVTDMENVKDMQLEEDSAVDHKPNDVTPEVVESASSDNNTLIDLDNDQMKKSDTKKFYDANSTLVKHGRTQKSVDEQKSTNSKIAIAKNEDAFEERNDLIKDVISNGKESAIAINDPQKAENISSVTIENEKSTKPNTSSNGNTEEVLAEVKPQDPFKEIEAGKKSIYDEIAEQEDEIEVAETVESKWSAGPSIAPVYFNAIGEGSPVHSIFVPNSKSGDVNLSYGLAVSYEISKKLSIKTGVHKVDYGYNTNDVEFSASLEGFGGGQIENIDYSLASRNIVVESKASSRDSFSEDKALDAAAQDPSLIGVMAQQFGYLEIPLELNYTLVDSKFGVNLIGGLSSLFLVDNSVTLTSGELITEMGEANNVNNVNFSTNIGFGVNYKFSPKIKLNIEPVFKYQLNTFSDTAGDFQPFTIGIYSGLNFKF